MPPTGPRRGSPLASLAAEFHVAECLVRQGYAVSLTLAKEKEVDLAAHHPDGRTVTIDAKGLKNTTNWPVRPRRRSPQHFYALVCYRNRFANLDVAPEVFIVPSTQIDSLLGLWAHASRPDQTAIGYNRVKNSRYRDAWHLLFPDAKGGKSKRRSS